MHGCQDPLLNTKTAPTHQRGSSCTSVRLAMDTSAVSLTAHAAPVVNIVRGHIKRAACRFRTRWLSTHAHTHTHTHTHTHGCTLALVNAKFMRAHIHTHAHSMMSTLVHQDSQRGGLDSRHACPAPVSASPAAPRLISSRKRRRCCPVPWPVQRLSLLAPSRHSCLALYV